MGSRQMARQGRTSPPLVIFATVAFVSSAEVVRRPSARMCWAVEMVFIHCSHWFVSQRGSVLRSMRRFV